MVFRGIIDEVLKSGVTTERILSIARPESTVD